MTTRPCSPSAARSSRPGGVTRVVSVLALCAGLACEPGDSLAASTLAEDFRQPPHEAKIWSFWWFEGGYGGSEGMRRDIAEMKAKGWGGVQHMQTVNSGGLPVPREVKMLTPEWDAWFGEALGLARDAGITVSASILDGWAHGGWWVEPINSAKQLVYTETQVEAGAGLAPLVLPQPLTRLGLYRDVVVVAFPERERLRPPPLTITASPVDEGYCKEENWPAAHAADGDPRTYWKTAPKAAYSAEKPVTLTFTYANEERMAAVYLAGDAGAGAARGEIQSSEDDGKTFRTLAPFALGPGEARRVEFPAATARVFRLAIHAAHAPDLRLAECQFLRAGDEPWVRAGIQNWDMKSANRSWFGAPDQFAESLDSEDADDGTFDLRSSEVLDLGARLKPDGTLDWRPPAGRWTVLRFGWTPLAEPARKGSGGWEVDVLSPARADFMMDTVARRMKALSDRHAAGAPMLFHTDSWEIGAGAKGQQPTWTEDFADRFRDRRGYPITRYLPAMARRVVDGREQTNRFLWDMRATVADCISAYYGCLQERAHAMGCAINSESGYGSYPHPHLNGLEVFGRSDRPMAELWHPFGRYGKQLLDEVDVLRTAASSAHIYGRRFVQAESITFHPWQGVFTAPEGYRETLQAGWLRGLNQAVVHKYVHQPEERKPGLVDYSVLDRHFSWWPLADGLTGFVARAQSMLQRGEPAADVAYYVGDGAARYVPSKTVIRPALPSGFDYDGLNQEVLLNKAAVRDGLLTLSTGPRYRYLVLTETQCRTLTLPTVLKLRELVESGLTLVGRRPARSPGLGRESGSRGDFEKAVAGMWGDAAGDRGDRRVGRGRVVWGRPLADLFHADAVPPACEFAAEGEASGLEWIQRRDGERDIFYLVNRGASAVSGAVRLRGAGPAVDLYDPLNGEARALPEVKTLPDGRLEVPVRFDPGQGYFLVAGPGSAGEPAPTKVNFPAIEPLGEVGSPWRVAFDAAWVKPLPAGGANGGRVEIALPKLIDLAKHDEPGVRGYSGVAVYETRFDAPASASGRERLWLDLGVVKELARVTLNGRELGVVWAGPRRVLIPAGLLTATDNALRIEVANLWTNRLIADRTLPAGERLTRVGHDLYGRAGKALVPSGLIGPVMLMADTVVRR